MALHTRLAFTFALLSSVALGAAQQRGVGPGQGGAVITGHVTDSAGRSVPGVIIVPMQPLRSAGGRLSRVSTERVLTGTDGAYRISVPALGDYYVVAIPTAEPAGSVGVGVTYYPNAASADTAKPVTVTPTGMVPADIALIRTPLASIAGDVTSADGTPTESGWLRLERGDGLFGLLGARVPIQAGGHFRITQLPPGEYFLQMREGVWGRLPAPVVEMPKVSGATVNLAGADAIGVKVAPIKPVRVSGKVIVHSRSGAAIDPSTLRVSGFPKNSDGNPGPQIPGAVQPDMTFEFQTWPALGNVRVFDGRGAVTPVVVRLNGVDVTERGIDFVAGAKISGVEVEFTIR